MPPPAFQMHGAAAQRRWRIGLQVGGAVLALLAVTVMVNYLAGRHFRRFHWGGAARQELSAQTHSVLRAITNDVRAVLLFDRDDPLFASVSGLLKEYRYVCPRLTVEHVDYARNLAEAQLVAARYQLTSADSDVVVFEVAGRPARVVRASELSEYDPAPLFAGQKEVRRTGFKGEELFTAALLGVTEGRQPKAYFLQGHNEHDPASDDRQMGYRKFARLLETKNIGWEKWNLLTATNVPDDCALLIVAGPQHRYEPVELERIGRYLAQGGRLLASLSYFRAHQTPTGFEAFLANWGVAVGDNYALDPPHSTPATGYDLIVTNFSMHPLVQPLRDSSLYLLLARSVEPRTPAGTGDAPKVTALIATSSTGMTASELGPGGMLRSHPVRDRRGAIPLAVAVERGSLPGIRADRGSTRIVVVGDSILFGNETLGKVGNGDFATLAVNWLLDRPALLTGLGPRPVLEYRVTLTKSDLGTLRWLLLGALPGVVVLIGLLVWVRRRA